MAKSLYKNLQERIVELIKKDSRTKTEEAELHDLRIKVRRTREMAIMWVSEAQGLLNASECLRKRYYYHKPMSKGFVRQQVEANRKAGTLLLCLAVENSLKAALIAREIIDFKNDKQYAHFHTHNLLHLHSYLVKSGACPNINRARLEEAQRTIEWGGKYPIPKTSKQFGDLVSMSHRNELRRYINKLWSIVFEIEEKLEL